MPSNANWTREQLLVAFNLYCRLPFGKLHSRNSDIIKYAKLIGRTPSALAMKLTNIASLDPAITSTGRRGLKGASQADKTMWHEMQSNWEQFAVESYKAIEAVSAEVSSDAEPESQQTLEPEEILDYTGRSRTAQVQARIGQDFFRKAVLSAYSYKCCITGLAVPELLVASHIIPWSVDIENRLNPKNGLCLSALHDKAFDKGIITITEQCVVRISKRKTVEHDEFYRIAMLAYDGKRISLPQKFQPDPGFLAYHRERVFEH